MFVQEKRDGEALLVTPLEIAAPLNNWDLAAALLRKTRSYLAFTGVWVNHLPSGPDQDCSVTGLRRFAWEFDRGDRGHILAYAAEALRYAIYGKRQGCSIPDWNDQPHRKLSEVLAAFDLAIDYAEKYSREIGQ